MQSKMETKHPFLGKVLLNCDMGESFSLYKLGNDDELFEVIDLANVACGFHAGDFSVMADTVKKAKAKGVSIGAHPSFPDLQGFGRRAMALTPEEVKHSVMYQVGALKAFLDVEEMQLSHIKPHGSLYGVASRDRKVCAAIVEVCKTYQVPLIGMSGTFHESVAKDFGVPFLAEFFADLEYDDNGSLIIDRSHSPVDLEKVLTRVQNALHGKYYSVSGKVFDICPNSICIHSDTPNVEAVARAVHAVLEKFNMFGNASNMDSIRSVLVANRGEIACRVIRTCRKMGIKTLAIYEASDENTLHTLEADNSIELPKGDTYVSIDAIVKICRQYKVDAVHPGYGFLSENPTFCEALENIGVIFLGPKSETIRKFGLKHAARELATLAGVPVVPGTGILLDIDDAVGEADKLSYPVLLKATGGGGGIGMQVCADVNQLRKAFPEVQNSAEKYFGNSGVYLEKYYQQSRHIEVQVFGDGLGGVIHLGERECSVQRRHQKVIEETPSPFLEERPDLRQEICDAAVKLAEMVNYRSAGTVEFLVVDEGQGNPDTGKYFFLEMNTRLQVEHGITELTNGMDLVEWMLVLGSKQTCDHFNLDQYHWKPNGHAIEVRIYAENPALNFQPSPGLLTKVSWPVLENVRVDTWVKSGSQITTEYDPLLAKMMVHGQDRNTSISLLSKALSETTVAGPLTNLDYIRTVLQHEDFKSGQTTTQILKKVKYTPHAIRVLQGGPDTTVQDWPGRIGLRVYGIQPNGPMDDLAFRVANLLVGNDSGAAGLEMTMQGPKLYFYVDSLVAMTGANIAVTLSTSDLKSVSKKPWTRFFVPAGSTLSIGKVRKGGSGCRSYLAVFGGIQVSDYLSSKSTFAAFGYGGFQGRTLQPNDMLPVVEYDRATVGDIENDVPLPEVLIPSYHKKWEIKCMPGPHAAPDYITTAGMVEVFSAAWEVHYNSAKMGVRLKGPTPQWARKDGGDGGSHPSNIHDVGYGLGGCNFTGDSPVILTCDGPTQGGFTCPWTVVSSEMWKVGQVTPGDLVRFCPISIDDALLIATKQEQYLATVKQVAMFPNMPVPLPSSSFLSEMSDSDTDVGNVHYDTAILDELPDDLSSNRPSIQYRQCGDCYVLVEYGDPKGSVDLNIFARVRLMQQTLRLHTDPKTQKVENPLLPGTLDCAPSIRSLLIRYNARIIPQITLVAYLKKLELSLPDVRQVVFPSRDIRMPIAFDDHWSMEATDQYRKSIRPEASYLPSNVEFIAQNNGLTGGKEEVLEHVVETSFLTLGVGFFLGCPFICPINPLHRLRVPKYNPSRVYTPAGTVGLGGSLCAIYPIESPGGYQMYGRTIPTWDTFGSVSPFTPDQPWLINLFDKLTFYKVSEKELLHLRKLAVAGKFKYEIKESTFDMIEYNKLELRVEKEYKERDAIRRVASAKMKQIEDQILLKQAKAPVEYAPQKIQGIPEGQRACPALLAGVIKDLKVKKGDKVKADESVICVLEAMKTEMEVTSDVSGEVVKVLGVPGQQVSAHDIVCILAV